MKTVHRQRGRVVSRVLAVATVFAVIFCVLPGEKCARADKVYDIQCGCFRNGENARTLVDLLNERNLPWYSRHTDDCTSFIIDANIPRRGDPSFVAQYAAFANTLLVKNFWDLPHPDPYSITCLPDRDTFIAVMAPYMQQQYKNGCFNPRKRSLEGDRARMYSGFIFDAASYYRIDPFLLFAIGNYETYFRNMNGDLDRMKMPRPDPAQGMFQILESTEREIFRDMKRNDIPHAPAVLPSDLRTHPKTQIYFAAHYFHMLQEKTFHNRYMALLGYNGMKDPSFGYPGRVMRLYERAINYFSESSRQCEQDRLSPPRRLLANSNPS